jgi:hypothetical protein
MADVNFIEFGTEPFFIERTSPYIEQYKIRGVQLLPNNSLPYVQVTSVKGGIELEDWTVYVVGSCGNETDVTNYFTVEDIFTDDNGDNQFVWSITNVPFDFGYDLVHLKAIQTIGETFYSNWFLFTENESDLTTRVDYKHYNSDYMQSIQLPIAFKQEFKPIEIETYYETSTKNTVINTIKEQSYENWLTGLISNDLLLKIIKVFTYKFTYVNLVRCNLFEAIEQKEFEAAENFAENIIKLSFNKSDVYDPKQEDIQIIESVPSITLNSINVNSINAIYNFYLENFTPDYLAYEYSNDQSTWVSTNQNTTSPTNIPFTETGTWYFRISHPLAVSNVIQLDLGSDLVANDDIFSLTKGGVVDIDVMFNDILVGDVVISNLSIPANGTLLLIDGGKKVRYTHDDSETTTDSFTYTITNGIDSDTATVNIVINDLSTIQMAILFGTPTKEDVCDLYLGDENFLGTTVYHDGLNVPRVGNKIYIEGLDGLILFDGDDLWYRIERGRAIQVSPQGVVINIGVC